MWFGIPKECDLQPHCEEKRVALTPPGVRDLVEAGAEVVVESGAGAPAGFLDEAYRKVGAQIVYSHEEAFGRADMVVKVGRPSPQEIELLQPNAGIMAFLHLAVAGEAYTSAIIQRKATAIGFEVIQDGDGTLPVLKISSEIAGKMAPQIAGRLLETTSGGIGILLGGCPGIPSADVVIIGAGTIGFHAARAFLGLGCSVYVLDISQTKLESFDRHFGGRIVTAHATRENLEKFSAFAEVLVGAVLVPGEIAPIVVTREMVQRMRSGSVILDFSFDQGGCVETTRLQGPTGGVFVREGVLHFAVPNCPSYVARTSSHALTYALLPFLKSMQEKGLNDAMRTWADIRRGCYTFEGQVVSRHISKNPIDLKKLLGEG
jgi:alanine dehydrogenase